MPEILFLPLKWCIKRGLNENKLVKPAGATESLAQIVMQHRCLALWIFCSPVHSVAFSKFTNASLLFVHF